MSYRYRYVGVVAVTGYGTADTPLADETKTVVRVEGSEEVVKRAIVEALSSTANLGGTLYSVTIDRHVKP